MTSFVPADLLAEEISFAQLKDILEKLRAWDGDAVPTDLLRSVDAGFEAALVARNERREEPSTEEAVRTARANRLYGLFKLLSNDEKGRAAWHRLATEDPRLDRDQVVLDLWNVLETYDPQHAQRIGSSAAYHRAWLFDLFLGHYDLRRSSRTAGAGGWLVNFPVGLLVTVGALFILRRMPQTVTIPAWAWVLAVAAVYAAIVVPLAIQFRRRLSSGAEATILALQSLVPRLAGAAAVGLVILASSEELLELVIEVRWPWLLLPLLGGFLYLVIEMARRVHPLPPLRRLALHGLDVWLIGLCHALALTLVAERGLRKILDAGGVGPFAWQAALSVTVFLFAIGLIVNLIWAEQPITEPL